MRGPRVLMTTDTVGGVLGYSLDLSRAIVARGGEVLLVRLGPPGSGALERAVAELPGVSLICSNSKLEWMDGAEDDVRRSGALLLELERRFRPDLVHLNGYAHGALPFTAPVLVVAHSCVLSWWEAVYGAPAPAKYAAYRAWVQDGLQAADAVAAPSASMLHALRRHYTPAFEGLVIHNAADSTERAPSSQREGASCAGRLWDPAKGLELLVRAAPESGWAFRVAGEVCAPEATGAAADWRADLPANVRLLGVVPRARLGEVMAESALYVHPARYEPFGLSVLEAARAGCALVLADLPSLRELWQGAAAFFPAGDAGALRAVLIRLREDAGERLRLARRASLRARRYAVRRFAQRYLALYGRLVQRGRGRPRARASVPHVQGIVSV